MCRRVFGACLGCLQVDLTYFLGNRFCFASCPCQCGADTQIARLGKCICVCGHYDGGALCGKVNDSARVAHPEKIFGHAMLILK